MTRTSERSASRTWLTQAGRIASFALRCDLVGMSMSAWSRLEAERAFSVATRARRRAALLCRLRHRGCGCGRLAVFDGATLRRTAAQAGGGIRDIPLDAIRGTLEPNRAAQFDPDFRPDSRARERWERIWLAEQRGAALPPISVVQLGDDYAIRDGHHRVSVARARGACTISAIVDLQ